MSITARTQIRNFTEGGIMGHLLRFGIPILLGNLMMIFLNTVDMIVVGQVLGEAGSSAISMIALSPTVPITSPSEISLPTFILLLSSGERFL